MNYIAHTKKNAENKFSVQTIKTHSLNTEKLARNFALEPYRDIAGTAALLHDIGKYSEEFQNYIRKSSLYPEKKIKGPHHAICGAVEANKLYPKDKLISLLLSYIIYGHHIGLPDGIHNVKEAIVENSLSDYQHYKEELSIPPVDDAAYKQYLLQNYETLNKNEKDAAIIDQFAFDTRYIFSCLVDADSLDTRFFHRYNATQSLCCQGKVLESRVGNYEAALQKVNNILNSFSAETELQKVRSEIQAQAYESTTTEINLLSMPTGSGKTLCSLKLAMENLIKNNKKRIIYIIPYNSIIDQTAFIFESIFGSDVPILRHQSTYAVEDAEEADTKWIYDAIKNWDAPFIITTSAQFFESIYGNKRNKLRRLHNMGDSILVFDEIHKLPDKYLQPCLQSISYLTKFCNSQAFLLSATMPNFEELIRKYALPNSEIKDLIPDKTKFGVFKKCKFASSPAQTEKDLADEMCEFHAALTITNRKKTAIDIYRYLQNRYKHCFVLTTYQTPKDRIAMIIEIKAYLKTLQEKYPDYENVPDDEKIMVVSTSLIEAGVDLDFETVFREISGLDSILQAAGRCNREGKRSCGNVFVFDLPGNSSDHKNILTNKLLEKYEDIQSTECIAEYYEEYYASVTRQEDFEGNTIHSMTDSLDNIPFNTYAKEFAYIDSKTCSVIIPEDEKSRTLMEAIETESAYNLRELQPYTCQISENERDKLLNENVIALKNGIYYLVDDGRYCKETGIIV